MIQIHLTTLMWAAPLGFVLAGIAMVATSSTESWGLWTVPDGRFFLGLLLMAVGVLLGLGMALVLLIQWLGGA